MIERLARRVRAILNTGRSTAASLEGATPSVQVAFIGTVNGGPQLRDGFPSVQNYGFASATLPGCDYVVGFLSGDNSKGVAFGSNDRRFRPTTLQPGESVVFDNLGRQIYLSAGGIIIQAAGATITVNNATTVTINASAEVIMNTPILKVSGDIQDNYESNTRTMATMRSIYDSHNHPVTGVQAGDSTVTTSAPNQQE